MPKTQAERARDYRGRQRLRGAIASDSAPPPLESNPTEVRDPAVLQAKALTDVPKRPVFVASIDHPNRASGYVPKDPLPVSDIYLPPSYDVAAANLQAGRWSGVFTPETGLVLDQNPDGGHGRSYVWSESSAAEEMQREERSRAEAEDARRQFLLPDYLRRTPHAD